MKASINPVTLTLLSLLLTPSIVFAGEGKWKKHHPRRAEVVGRANREENKNADAEKSGKITQNQENRLNRQDNLIKKEEQADAAAQGGHITKSEQRDLNRQENRVNRERARMEKRDANKAVPVTPAASGTTAPTSP